MFKNSFETTLKSVTKGQRIMFWLRVFVPIDKRLNLPRILWPSFDVFSM